MARYKLLHIPTGKYVIQIIGRNCGMAHNSYWLEGVDPRLHNLDSNSTTPYFSEDKKATIFLENRTGPQLRQNIWIDLCYLTNTPIYDSETAARSLMYFEEFQWIEERD